MGKHTGNQSTCDALGKEWITRIVFVLQLTLAHALQKLKQKMRPSIRLLSGIRNRSFEKLLFFQSIAAESIPDILCIYPANHIAHPGLDPAALTGIRINQDLHSVLPAVSGTGIIKHDISFRHGRAYNIL